MWTTLDLGYWLSLIIAVPTAGLLVRLFMIQHDCGHGSFFRYRVANDWVGRVIGALTPNALRFLAAQPRAPSRRLEISTGAVSVTSPRSRYASISHRADGRGCATDCIAIRP